MATYAIGDIQGCYDELQQLLDLINFNPKHDRLWFVGDLVNRGPKSLEVLRFVKSLGDRAVVVLGNHDLHLLAVYSGTKSIKSESSLKQVLDASDAHELMLWLRHRPLLHCDPDLDFCVLHAGLPPQWTIDDAKRLAKEAEAVLQDQWLYKSFFEQMYGNKPHLWDERHFGIKRLRFIINAFTRIRYITPKGKINFTEKLHPKNTSTKYTPWFRVENRASMDQNIVFGHWSTLGINHEHKAWAIDTGCLWGGMLSALRLEDQEVISLNCTGHPSDRIRPT